MNSELVLALVAVLFALVWLWSLLRAGRDDDRPAR